MSFGERVIYEIAGDAEMKSVVGQSSNIDGVQKC